MVASDKHSGLFHKEVNQDHKLQRRSYISDWGLAIAGKLT